MASAETPKGVEETAGHLVGSSSVPPPAPCPGDILIRNLCHPDTCAKPPGRPWVVRQAGRDLVLKLLLTLANVALSLASAGTSPAQWGCLSPAPRCPTFSETPHRVLIMERSELGQSSVIQMWC